MIFPEAWPIYFCTIVSKVKSSNKLTEKAGFVLLIVDRLIHLRKINTDSFKLKKL